METFLLTLVVFALIIVAGVVVSVRLYNQGLFETGRFRRIRRVRSSPDGPVIEEIIEEAVPVEEEV